ncbi:hypothetical protein ACHAWX_001943, partial [Stephanocyclus meneghinianus]
TGSSDKKVVKASDNILQAADKIKLAICNFPKASKEAHVVPTMVPKALMSIKALAESRHTTIFHPYKQSVPAHAQYDIALTSSAPPVLQGWRDEKGLWMVPIVDHTHVSPALDTTKLAFNLYKLPTTKEVVRFLHAALDFQQKPHYLQQLEMGTSSHFPASLWKTLQSISPSQMKL